MIEKGISSLDNQEKKVIESFVKELRKRLGNNIVSIRLFGSKVRGDFKEDSDIDIFILVKEKREARNEISDIAADYFFETNIPLSPVVYSLFEYKKNKELNSFFVENVEKEGIVL
jgi:predicted nucleotidyltransferase